jgi:hypothetical protein
MTPKSTYTAKGSIAAATGASTPANLAVGNNGETLVADSSTSTGLRYTSNFAAGKNKIINGDFYINQRNFTSQTTSDYCFDRFKTVSASGTVTTSAQVFTTGTAPVAGYEGKNYLRYITTGQTGASAYAIIQQNIESVRTFANQTVTASFWAKAASGTPKIAVEVEQYFGSGGSPSASVDTLGGQVTLSTSWARYTVTISVPSISGKTLGTSNNDFLQLNLWTSAGTDYNSRTNSLGIQSNTFEVWGVQLEAGSVATAFQTATGTIQGELAACQRYYFQTGAGGASGSSSGRPYPLGVALSTTQMAVTIPFTQTMRIAPTAVSYYNLRAYDGASFITVTSVTFADASPSFGNIALNAASGFTQYRPTFPAQDGTSGYIAFSAEL